MGLFHDVIRGLFPPQVPLWAKALFPVSMIIGLLTNSIASSILADTNKYKPHAEKDSNTSWDLQKGLRVFNQYEQEYTSGRKTFWFKVCFMLAALTFLAWFFLSIYYVSLA